jgi:hypothetical protein
MLICLVFLLTVYLFTKICKAKSAANAVGYLLASGLIPVPIMILGNSVESGLFPVDVCLLVYFLKYGVRSLSGPRGSKALSAGVLSLLGFAVLATTSAIYHVIFIDSAPWTFYSFTVLKFWEYALLAASVMSVKLDREQFRRICIILLIGISIYECLHVLHISGLVPMSGSEYFGPRAADFAAEAGEDPGGSGAAPFSDRTAWFLTSYRAVIGGTTSITALFCLLVFELFEGRIRRIAGITGILCVLSVLSTSSRSDIAGLLVAVLILVLCSPIRSWKTFACALLIVAGLYTAFLAVLPEEARTMALDRVSEFWNPELRSEGDYASREYDRAAMLDYLPNHPRELLIGVGPGNYHWYSAQRITMNSFGHNSYLHWTGELGIGGLLLLLGWCTSACIYAIRRIGQRNVTCSLCARIALAIVVSRIVAAWGAESLFGTQGMGYYSIFFVGVVYLLLSAVSNCGGGRDLVGARQSKEYLDLNEHEPVSVTASWQLSAQNADPCRPTVKQSYLS